MSEDAHNQSERLETSSDPFLHGLKRRVEDLRGYIQENRYQDALRVTDYLDGVLDAWLSSGYTPRNYTSFQEYETQLRPEHALIIHQYRKVAGAMDIFWKEISIRTNGGSWREDGVGSCDIDKALSEDLIDGPTFGDIVRLRERRNYETPGERRYCPYHRIGKGCVLGDLKSPRCLDHVDYGHFEEIPERFGIQIPDMRTPLHRILLGGMNPREGDWKIKPHVNDEFVQTTYDEITGLTEYIKTFPILHPDEVESL